MKSYWNLKRGVIKMKPNRCRIMCPDCLKPKMQFETEGEAKRFIQYNGEEISEKPENLRVYYCPSCCCYHITSKKIKSNYMHNTDRLLKAYNESLLAENQDKIEIIRNIREIIDIDKRITIPKTGTKKIVKFRVDDGVVLGVDANNNNFNLYNIGVIELESMLKKLCRKHFNL